MTVISHAPFKSCVIQNPSQNNNRRRREFITLWFAEEMNESEIDERLIDATRRGDEYLVRSLLDEGVDVNSRERTVLGLTALHIATYSGFESIVSLLIERGADVNAKDLYVISFFLSVLIDDDLVWKYFSSLGL